jgi:hypothetical protein
MRRKRAQVGKISPLNQHATNSRAPNGKPQGSKVKGNRVKEARPGLRFANRQGALPALVGVAAQPHQKRSPLPGGNVPRLWAYGLRRTEVERLTWARIAGVWERSMARPTMLLGLGRVAEGKRRPAHRRRIVWCR